MTVYGGFAGGSNHWAQTDNFQNSWRGERGGNRQAGEQNQQVEEVSPTQSVNDAWMDTSNDQDMMMPESDTSMDTMSTSMDGMDMTSGTNGEMPAMHSGTDHLMQSGLMMEGDMQQDFTMQDSMGNYTLDSMITANENVVQDAAQRILAASPMIAEGAANGDQQAINLFENWVAQELTNINDVENIQDPAAREAFIAQAEANGLSAEEMDHLLHTPITQVGTGAMIDENSSISGQLHTVDLARTRAEEQGDGTFAVHLVSNNGQNNAHDNMDIATFYAEAGSAEEAVGLVNAAAERGGLSAEPPYSLTDAGMDILMQNIAQYG